MTAYDMSWAPPGHLKSNSSDTASRSETMPPAPAPESEPIVADVIPRLVEPVDDTPLSERDAKLFGLVELILKNRPRLHRLLAEPAFRAVLAPRLLAISLVGFVLFGVAMSLVLSVSGHWPALASIAAWLESPQTPFVGFDTTRGAGGPWTPWWNGDALALTAAYAFGLVAASCVCLPSLYFYCLLAGAPMTMVEVVLHALKAKAVAAVALVGILPIYVAVAMGAMIFGGGDHMLRFTLACGLLLPAVAGLWGTTSLYRGFMQLCQMTPGERAYRRACFLRRLVLAWSAVYTAIVPVMVYAIWEALA